MVRQLLQELQGVGNEYALGCRVVGNFVNDDVFRSLGHRLRCKSVTVMIFTLQGDKYISILYLSRVCCNPATRQKRVIY